MHTVSQARRGRALAAGVGMTVIGALALSGCTPSVSGTDGSELTILLGDTVDTLDPTLSASIGARQINWMTYETLLRQDADTGELLPGLAESWELTPTSATFVIRDDVTCSDGTPFTASTVARNLERWSDPETAAPLVGSLLGGPGFTVEVDDATRTVSVELASSLPFLAESPGFVFGPGIICDGGLDDTSVLTSESHGTGPYVLDEYVNGSHALLSRRDDYVAADPDFDIQTIPATLRMNIVTDPDTQANLLLSGDADLAALDSSLLSRFDGNDSFTTTLAATGMNLMMFNHRDGNVGADLAVRTALAQALDFQDIADVQTGGVGYAASWLRPPTELCVDADATGAAMPSGGAAAAKATLEADGWTIGANGIYEKDGTELTVTLLGMELSASAAELISAEWGEAGIGVTYDDRAVSQALDVLYSGTGWDVTFVGMSGSVPTSMIPFFSGAAAPDGANFGAVDNVDYTELAAEAVTVGGLESCSLWIEAETSLVADADIIPAFARDDLWVGASGVSFSNNRLQLDPLSLRAQ